MNRKLIYLHLLLAIMTLGACKKDNIKTYNDASSMNSIYFPLAETTNYINISFGYSKSTQTDSIVSIVVRAIGSAQSVDRPYNLSIADSSTMKAGVDYEVVNKALAIKAGTVADTLKIKLLRTTRIRTDSAFLYLDLKPNDNFTNSYLSHQITTGGKIQTLYYTRLRIKDDDIAGPPPFWTVGNSYYSYTAGYLGTYSTLKFQLLITRYNLSVTDLVQANWFLTNGNYKRISAWADGLKAYFAQMAPAGTPVYEADGKTLMTMGPNAK